MRVKKKPAEIPHYFLLEVKSSFANLFGFFLTLGKKQFSSSETTHQVNENFLFFDL